MRGSTILVPHTSESPEGQGLLLLPWLEPEHATDEGLVPVWRAHGRAASAPASGAGGPDICKQFSGALRRCFPPAAWQPDAAQKLAGSLEASLSPALRCEPRPARAGAGEHAAGGRAGWGPAGPLGGAVLGSRAEQGGACGQS